MKQESVCYLGVHPYSSCGSYETQSFIRKRNRRIWNSELTQFLFIEQYDLEEAIEVLGLDQQRWHNKIILTNNADPACTDFDGVANMILKTAPADRYVLWGAELVIHKGQAVGACVEYICRNLPLPRKEIDVKNCFRTPYSVYRRVLKAIQPRNVS